MVILCMMMGWYRFLVYWYGIFFSRENSDVVTDTNGYVFGVPIIFINIIAG